MSEIENVNDDLLSKIENIQDDYLSKYVDISFDYTILQGKFINVSGNNIYHTNEGEVDRVIAVPIVGGNTYLVSLTTKTSMRVSSGSNQNPPLQTPLTTIKTRNNETTDIEFTTNDIDNYLYIQLFTNNDAESLQTINANINHLSIKKLLSFDGLGDIEIELINEKLDKNQTNSNYGAMMFVDRGGDLIPYWPYEGLGNIEWGISNARANVLQLSSIQYTLLAQIPRRASEGTYWPAGNYTGIPYTQNKQYAKLVGTDVLIDTFMTAAHNPNSVLYTRVATDSESGPYYGCQCNGLIWHAWAFPFIYSTASLEEDAPYIVPVQLKNVMPFDMVVNNYHTRLIYDITRDTYGRITDVRVLETAGAGPKFVNYTYSAFVTHCNANGYRAYRNIRLYDTEYEPCRYIGYFDDDVIDDTYSDITTIYGDWAAITPVDPYDNSTSVPVNILDASGYDTIVVKKDGTTIDTRTNITDFSISDVSYGTYQVIMSGPSKSCSTEFIVVDVNASLNENEISFSSENGECIYIKGLDSGWVVRKNITINDAQRTAGKADVSSILDVANERGIVRLRVGFRCKYGNAFTDIVL